MIEITQLQEGKKVFFISDLHLPAAINHQKTEIEREKKVIAWLDYVQPQIQALFLLGDIFDFWFEYNYLVPKVSLPFQAKLLELYHAHIPIYFFLGNHDCWSKDYLTQQCGVIIVKAPASISICGRQFFIGHGDTIAPSIYGRLLEKIYRNAVFQSIVRILPSDWLYRMVYHCWIKKKQAVAMDKDNSLAKKDRIFVYCKNHIEPFAHHDFYIFGHTHRPCLQKIHHKSYYCNLGDWISHYTYACFDGLTLSLLNF